jgi:hypothetical protein
VCRGSRIRGVVSTRGSRELRVRFALWFGRREEGRRRPVDKK